MKVKNIKAIEILDSNGNPTISTEIEVYSGEKGRAEVPSGASTGTTEVVELRDEDKDRYNGKGVLKAIDIINTKIRNLLIDKEFTSQKEFDNLLIKEDGTELKENLGGNSILSCSMAFARAVSNAFGLELYQYLAMTYWDKEYDNRNFILPTPQILVLEGAKHGNWATDIQEYMIVPNMDKFKLFSEGLRASTEVFHSIHSVLDEKNYSVGLGFEGGYAPKELNGNKEAFDIIMKGIEKAGYLPEKDFTLAVDIAASEFYDSKEKKYILKKEGKSLDSNEFISLQREWLSQYPISSIEDPLDEDDWKKWIEYTKEFGDKYMVVGDDLLTTNSKRIQEGIEKKAMNTVLIKLNQIGTVTETLDAIKLSTESNIKTIISHRSGETNDDFIADLVIATPAQYSKFGAPSGGERVVKYNRLLSIEKDLEG